MTLKDKLVTGLWTVGFVAALVVLSQDTENTRVVDGTEKTKTSVQQNTKSDIYNQFKEKADANHDGHLMESELIPVYDLLGLKYDAREPDNLTEDQMNKYVDIKK